MARLRADDEAAARASTASRRLIALARAAGRTIRQGLPRTSASGLPSFFARQAMIQFGREAGTALGPPDADTVRSAPQAERFTPAPRRPRE